ncbi:MAG: tRNA pseudouridine(55) synthase TruB [Coriobacteriales bacterium]|nr:tRNA pseudouridine(55) synthase TruB [Coriobacteriales bacterium]
MRRGESGLNFLLGIDKPTGLSSHDVVNRVRRVLGERRVGHAGTLDPAASGVLVVGVGQATRLMGLLTSDTKAYLAAISFGTQTSTDDAEGEVVRTAPVPESLMDADKARETLRSFLGVQMQVPPAYSAISVNGERAYAKARAGKEVELEPRQIEVLQAELISVMGEGCTWLCAFVVSKGTYIRALARDIGIATGSAAHLSQLTRTASGFVRSANCVSLERLAELGCESVRSVILDPVAALGLPVRHLRGNEMNAVQCGRALELEVDKSKHGDRYAIVEGDRLYGVWRATGSQLRPIANFPQGIEGVKQ